MADSPLPCRLAPAAQGSPEWRATFLAELAATSNVAASARRAEVSTTEVYKARRGDPAFYREWQEALCEGYDLLEMALLRRLREGELKPPTGAKRAARTYDNANALRLLAAHRESTTRQRAIMAFRDSDDVLASINAKIELIRERRQAALPAPDGVHARDDQ